MVVLFGLILSILYFGVALSGRRDIFSPRFIFNVYAWLKNVPYFMQIGNRYSEDVIIKYFIIKLIGFIMVNLGISVYEKHFAWKWRYDYRDIVDGRGKNAILRFYYAGWLCLIVGFGLKFQIIQGAGGLSYVLQHLQSRGVLLAGSGYSNTFSNYLLNCSVLCMGYYYYKTKKGKYSLIISVIVATALLLVFGARKPVMMLWVKILMCYHYCKKEIRLRDVFKPKYLSLIVIVFLLMLMIPMLRYTENSKVYQNPVLWVQAALDNANTIFREFSYLTGDMYCFEHFNISNCWWGQVYLNILVQWIPRSIFPAKPPMDDGMYLYNLMQGVKVTPNMPTESLLYQTSVPFTMEGALYANFSYIGIIIGCFAIGILYAYVYKVLIQTRANVFMIMIYQAVIFEFVPSVLHTVSPLICIIFTGIIMVPLLHIKIKKSLKRRYEKQIL